MTTLLAALLCAAVLQEPAARTLDYEMHAISLRQAFKAIGDQAGMKLVVSDDLAAEPIILRLKNVPVQEALDKIAEVVGGEWRKRDDGSLLFLRPDAMAERFEEEARKRRAAAFRKGIGEFTSRFAKFKPMDLAHARNVTSEISRLSKERSRNVRNLRFDRNMESPSYRLFARVIALLDPEELATIGPDERIVYTSQPNALQRPLEGPWQEIFDAYQFEQSNFATAAAQVATQADYALDPQAFGTPLDGGVAPKLVAVVQNDSRANWTTARVLLIVGDKAIAQPATFIDRSRSELLAINASVLRDMGLAKSDEPLAASQAVRSMRARMDWRTEPTSQITDEALARVLQPERIDPLANASSEALLGIANRHGQNLIAYLGDNFESFALQQGNREPVRPRAFLAEAQLMRDHVITSEGGWLVARCENPNDALRLRVPRPSLGQFVRSVQKDGRLTFESTSELLTNLYSDPAITFASHFAWLINSQEHYLLSRGHDVLRFYATLSMEQRAAIAAEKWEIPFGRLSARQKDLITSMWYSADIDIFKKATYIPGPPEEVYEMYEPTEVLPAGIPEDAMIELRLRTDPLVFVEEKRADRTSIGTPTIVGLAHIAVMREYPQHFPWEAQTEYGRAGLGSQRTFDLSIKATSVYSASANRMEPNPVGAKRMPLDQFIASLPPELRAEYDRELKASRERYAKLPPPQGDGMPTPPIPPP